MRFSLARDGEPQLAFDGEMLARLTSQRPHKKNWTELTIYRTDGGSYVVQTIARAQPGSLFRGQAMTDWFSARAHATAVEAVEGMRDRKRKTLSSLALSLLEEAADKDQGIADALDEVEGKEEVIK